MRIEPRILMFLRAFADLVDGMNNRVGRWVTYGIFIIMAILLWSTLSRVALAPSLWTLESAQFALVAYYFLGGAFAMQQEAHVRMDLLYGDWSTRRKAYFDAVTSVCLLFYLGVLFYGGFDSLSYALEYGERSASAWRPYLWPVKMIILLSLTLMLLQSLAMLARDILCLRGHSTT